MESRAKGMATAMSVRMRVDIVSYGNGMMRGELHSQYLDAPYVFYNLIRMIAKMEEIFDTNRYPEKFMTPRSFGIAKSGKKSNSSDSDTKGRDIINDQEKTDMDEMSGGSKCTFEISVRFRQNATWQGQILWAEKNLTQNFRSVLEMLKLMDEAITEGDKNSVAWEA